MGKWSDDILSSSPTNVSAGESNPRPKWSDDLLSGPAEASLVSGAPGYTAQVAPQEPAGLGTATKAAFMDDPRSRMKAFADARGLPVERYFIEGGAVKFVGPDGLVYEELPEADRASRAKDIAAKATAMAPAVVGEAVGTVAGGAYGHPFIGGTLGALAGEGAAQGIGYMIGDEPTMADPLNVALAGAAAPVGYGLGKLAAGGTNAALRVGRGPAADLAAQNYARINRPAIEAATRKFEAQGIPAAAPQVADLPSLQMQYKTARAQPGEAGVIVSDFDKAQEAAANEALRRNLAGISPQDSTGDAAVQGARTAKGIRESLVESRSASAKPFYEQARESAPEIDIAPVLSELESLASTAPSKSTASRALYRARGMLVRNETLPDGTVQQVPESRIEVLDNVKKEIDQMLKGPEGSSIVKDTRRRLMGVKDNLLSILDEASPEYREARAKYAELSKPINDFDESRLARLVELPEDRLEAASGLLLGQSSSPRNIRQARKFFEDAGATDKWDAMTRGYLQEVLSKAGREVETASDAGGRDYTMRSLVAWRNRVMKDQGLERLSAALSPKQLKGLEEYLDVLGMIGRTVDTNSDTAGKLAAQQAMRESARGPVANLVRAGKEAIVAPDQLLERLRSEEWMARAAAALTSTDGINKVKGLKQLPVGSVEFTKRLGAFLGVGAEEFAANAGPAEYDPFGARSSAKGTAQPTK